MGILISVFVFSFFFPECFSLSSIYIIQIFYAFVSGLLGKQSLQQARTYRTCFMQVWGSRVRSWRGQKGGSQPPYAVERSDCDCPQTVLRQGGAELIFQGVPVFSSWTCGFCIQAFLVLGTTSGPRWLRQVRLTGWCLTCSAWPPSFRLQALLRRLGPSLPTPFQRHLWEASSRSLGGCLLAPLCGSPCCHVWGVFSSAARLSAASFTPDEVAESVFYYWLLTYATLNSSYHRDISCLKQLHWALLCSVWVPEIYCCFREGTWSCSGESRTFAWLMALGKDMGPADL